MDFGQLRVYVTSVQEGSLSAAGRRLGLSQPAISNKIKALEEELGAQLLLRDARGVVGLTAAGEEFLTYAEQTLAAYWSMRQRVQHLRAEVRGHLRLAASPTLGEHFLPPLLAALRERRPEIEVQVTIAPSREVVRRVEAHDCDAGLISSPPTQSHLTFHRVAEDELLLAVPADHPFAQRHLIRFAELGSQRLILREAGSGTLASLESLLGQTEMALLRANAALTLGSPRALLQAVRAGLGLGFLSSFHLSPPPEGIRAVRIESYVLARGLYLVYERDRPKPQAVQVLLSFVREWGQARTQG